MAAGFKSPFFLLGLGALAVIPGGFSSPLFFLGLAGFEAEAEESPPAEEPEEMPENPSAAKRCTVSPWWRGTFARGVYQWEHTRMGLLGIQDFYWAAQTLTLTGSVGSDTASGQFGGSNTLFIEPYQLLEYQPRFVQADPTAGDGNYTITATYIFSQPLHWDGLDGTFCPEMAVRIDIGHNVSPDPPENLGYISTDPSIGEVCGRAYLLLDFKNGKELPLYYDRTGILTNVNAVVELTGARWVFED